MTNRRPVIYADDAFRLTLEVERTDAEVADGLLPMDDGTIRRFTKWMYDEGIHTFRGGASGPGFFTGTFPIAEKDAIMEWLENEGLILQ